MGRMLGSGGVQRGIGKGWAESGLDGEGDGREGVGRVGLELRRDRSDRHAAGRLSFCWEICNRLNG